MAFIYKQKVLFKHCDPAGIVFYPRQIEMVNDTVEAFFDEVLEYSFASIMRQSYGVPIVKLDVEFVEMNRLGDQLKISLTPTRIGKTSLNLELVCKCDESVRFRAKVTLVSVNDKQRPYPWTVDIVEKIQKMITQN